MIQHLESFPVEVKSEAEVSTYSRGVDAQLPGQDQERPSQDENVHLWRTERLKEKPSVMS